MAHRPHPRQASTDPHQGPWTTCDRCGWVTSQARMAFQYDFFGGPVPQNTGFLVCERCTDDLAWQYKLLVLPPDPLPIANIRPEVYAVDSTNFLTTQDGNILTAEDGTTLVVDIPNPTDPGNAVNLTAGPPPDPPPPTSPD